MIQVFELKAKYIIKKNWENILKAIFFLPDDILKDNKSDTFKWVDDFIQITNLTGIEKSLERIPVNSVTKPILKIICQHLDYIDEGHERIYNIYFEFFKQVNEEPICRRLSGFTGALDTFIDKRLKSSRLKNITKELQNMQNNFKEIINKMTPRKYTAVSKRKAYMRQMELVNKKFNNYQTQTERTGANKENRDYDVDYLKILQALVNELKEGHIALERALEEIVQIVNEFNDQRIIWTETLLNIQFYHTKERKHFCIFWNKTT